jgi:exodeoxyribonuclease VII small subunit
VTDADQPEPVATLGYAEAMAELESILHELEDGEVDIDHLAAQVRRAAELVRHCRGRLVDARTEVTRIVGELDDADPAIGADGTPVDDPAESIDRP